MIISAEWIDSSSIKVVTDDGDIKFVPDDPANRDRQELYEWEAEGNVITPYTAPVLTPIITPLTPDQFYTMLENEGKLDPFIAAIETVTPTSKKLTCRNQFNNSTEFTWDMIVVNLVMPKVYGVDWQTIVSPIWVNAYQTLLTTQPVI